MTDENFFDIGKRCDALHGHKKSTPERVHKYVYERKNSESLDKKSKNKSVYKIS